MKYIKKNRKSDEKKVVSTRIRTHIFDAFQNASEASKDHGYSISLSDVVETALITAVKEFAEISDVDYLSIELDRLHKEWEEEWEKEQEEQSRKRWAKEEVAMNEHYAQKSKEEEKVFEEEIEKNRIKQLEADQKAVLELSASELKDYQQKRSDEVAEKKLKNEEIIKRLKEEHDEDFKKYGEDSKYSFLFDKD
ncbi:hypothetical protein [uncultured Candidatus Thioglobus sp.]|jgi:hypothetical protein|uniref:hypothetical protein n=1 Tax=uncultured Candidatus Thioglobus sp. TaxID=655186 RepID=UPI001EB704BE|nr:hypothetical protein [Candidatus Thioglobus sp.]MBT4553460.1 hypothetical protein [Candidatus Thioglobus sp.]MBT6327484.1 hypothetical protein [Candidatus Thioglobus sp.]MBT6655501.1 hypothetical protein [Candidatus Thioglobus sp.]MBT7498890.1 hypothetical protein [Candidatus Thioglobus sp.]